MSIQASSGMPSQAKRVLTSIRAVMEKWAWLRRHAQITVLA
jgi:hypothetical protein